MSLISLKDVSVTFQEEVILKDVSIAVQKGESLVIIGPSGQGKTTLLKTLCGLITPGNGKVFFEQSEWMTLSSKERLQRLRKMGILFQRNALFDSLTCLENITFPLREVGELTTAEVHRRGLEYLEAVGLSSAANLYPDEISGGMQKRLGIARALALEPEIIFYDDPTAGLDPLTSRKIVELILGLKKKQNSTLVTVTNDMNRAFQMADRIAVVLNQEVIITGNPEQTKEHSDPRIRQFIRGEVVGPLQPLV